jgi:ligand-binding sensor domain-containing protein
MTALGRWLCVFGLLCSVTHAEDIRVDPSTHAAAWRFFDQSDGLIEGRIRAIETASDGKIWFAGRLGVCVYDGQTWQTVKDTPVACHDIEEGKDGTIWIASADGLYSLRDDVLDSTTVALWPDEGEVVPYPVRILSRGDEVYVAFGTDRSFEENPPGGIGVLRQGKWDLIDIRPVMGTPFVNDLCFDRQGRLWIATDEGVAVRDGTEWRRFGRADGLPGLRAHTLFGASTGDVWVSTSTGIAQYHNDKWTTTHLDGGLRARTLGVSEEFRRAPPIATSFAETSDGVVWTFGGGALHAWLGDRWSRKDIPLPGPGDLSGLRYRIEISDENVIWSPGFRVSRFDYGGGKWRSHVAIAGSPYADPDGSTWFARQDGTTLRIRSDGETSHEGTPWPVLRSRDGTLWSGGAGRIAKQVGGSWERVVSTSDTMIVSHVAREGGLWFVSKSEVVNIHPDQTVATYRSGDWPPGVPLGRKVIEDASGTLWFIPELIDNVNGHGILSFDGSSWQQLLFADLFPKRKFDTELQNRVYDAVVSPNGDLFVGTWEGVWARESGNWRFLEESDAPWDAKVVKLLAPADDELWLACATVPGGFSGVLRRKANQWTTFGPDDGLAGSDVWELARDNRGRIWAGTTTGASVYDGSGWTSLKKGDGLLEDDVRFISPDKEGSIWLGKGRHFDPETWWVTQYVPDLTPPDTELTYLPPKDLPESAFVTFGWRGVDAWKDTRTGSFTYARRLNDSPWSDFRPELTHSFRGLAPGVHQFEVKARDLDGNTDPSPATYSFHIVAPVWRQPWFLILVTCFGAIVGIQAVRMNRARMRALQDELDTAHQLQMDLMPSESPDLAGFDIAGRCIPADRVGGDFFNYYHNGDKLLFGLADVTGKAMEAAIPAVMFSGILESIAQPSTSLTDLLKQLNRTLYRKLDARKFICFVVGEIDLNTNVMELSDCGCPFPYIYRAATQQAEEIPVAAYPLGVSENNEFVVAELTLGPGDCIVFCSDGIAEAETTPGVQLGYEATLKIIEAACREETTSQGTIARILEDVRTLTRRQDQEDDLTCLVLRSKE